MTILTLREILILQKLAHASSNAFEIITPTHIVVRDDDRIQNAVNDLSLEMCLADCGGGGYLRDADYDAAARRKLAMGVTRALSFIHDCGMVHRALNPVNIIARRSSSTGKIDQLKIGGFIFTGPVHAGNESFVPPRAFISEKYTSPEVTRARKLQDYVRIVGAAEPESERRRRNNPDLDLEKELQDLVNAGEFETLAGMLSFDEYKSDIYSAAAIVATVLSSSATHDAAWRRTSGGIARCLESDPARRTAAISDIDYHIRATCGGAAEDLPPPPLAPRLPCTDAIVAALMQLPHVRSHNAAARVRSWVEIDRPVANLRRNDTEAWFTTKLYQYVTTHYGPCMENARCMYRFFRNATRALHDAPASVTSSAELEWLCFVALANAMCLSTLPNQNFALPRNCFSTDRYLSNRDVSRACAKAATPDLQTMITPFTYVVDDDAFAASFLYDMPRHFSRSGQPAWAYVLRYYWKQTNNEAPAVIDARVDALVQLQART